MGKQLLHSDGGRRMDRPTTLKQKAKITAGAVTSLIIVAWMVVVAIAFLSAR
jgi:hypothetical protein